MSTSDKRKARRAEQARLRSVHNTRPKKKSPSKLRRLERRAEARAAGIEKPKRKVFDIHSLRADPRNLSKSQKTGLILRKLRDTADTKRKPLEEMSKTELMTLAKEANIKGRSKMDKEQLVAALVTPRNPDADA